MATAMRTPRDHTAHPSCMTESRTTRQAKPSGARRAPHPLLTLRSIRRHDRASRDELARFQADRLRRVVRHAYAHVPYYRRLFDAHRVSPDDIRSADDLVRIPVTTRKTLQELPEEESVARGVRADRLIRYSTSGWSGRPLTVRRSWMESRLLGAIRIRAMRSFGLEPDDVVVIAKSAVKRVHEGAGLVERVLRVLRKDRWQVVDCNLPCDEVVRRFDATEVMSIASIPASESSR